ncbi:MAG: radical SAM/SPASM domain protein, ACGX system [Synergistaceae bacterium]|nr:radical SAM/SPASM domain protein, ACGX system [Synergistaceae bacterium]MBQ9573866.1 radical SAM/SPASM domain protein, ACGX system [Synergistaceae bacterium]
MRYFSFQWHITDICDQRCKHCYIYSGGNSHVPQSMSREEIHRVFANCLDFCGTFGRIPYFYITGGDPILHPYFWELLEAFSSNGINFSILGNPFHIDIGICKKLKALGCEKYQLSVDGLRETHDFFRKPGSYDETLSKIKPINDSGICSVIMSTVSSLNIHEIPGVIGAVVEHEAEVYSFARYCPSGSGMETGITPSEYREFLGVCDEIFRKYEAEGCRTYFDRKDHLWTLYEYETGRFKIPDDAEKGKIYSGCNCGNGHITILPSGDVYACRRVNDSKVGNALNNKLSDLWLNEMENYREYNNFVKCSKCELLPYCRGCPAVAKGTYGNFYAEDPQCWKEF